jgi:hypothetical protein
VWDIACLSRLNPLEVPPPKMMSLPQGKTDRRKIMVRRSPLSTIVFYQQSQSTFLLFFCLVQNTVYALFRGEAREQDLALAGHSGR